MKGKEVEIAGLSLSVHPHMLHHACGCATRLVQNQFTLGGTSWVRSKTVVNAQRRSL